MKAIEKKNLRRKRRKQHVRKNVTGTPDRPRLTIFRSNKNIYAQIIDDMAGHTLVAASTAEKSVCDDAVARGNCKGAKLVGQTLAEKATKVGITKVVFDRNGCAFHGRVKELADAAREGGLEF
ncbi:MAG: 50S ribosomal protein L18 [Phycisphaerae bacterium]|jgi:large subunit ribosomal protein L18|nr:50S ribosomal protein L18 [Phycisphaerae bacterium]MDP7290052.1 50S ribosomal protein L18 [Phycisphaerae bacterium]